MSGPQAGGGEQGVMSGPEAGGGERGVMSGPEAGGGCGGRPAAAGRRNQRVLMVFFFRAAWLRNMSTIRKITRMMPTMPTCRLAIEESSM